MAKTTAGVVAVVAILTAGVAARIDAAQGAEMAVVLHVTDYAHISRGVLAEAEQLAARVYRRPACAAIWTDGSARDRSTRRRLSCGLVTHVQGHGGPGRANRRESTDRSSAGPCSRSAAPTSSTIALYDHAMMTGSNVARLLAAVMRA